jgi:hypothetical protein
MLNIFTWHIHGSYLYYLSQGPYNIYIPVTETRREEGYYGRGQTFPFGNNVIEVPVAEVRNRRFDCILFQSAANFLTDQYEVLSPQQRELPRIYLEHNTPDAHPTDQLHVMNDPEVLLVHVTHFNHLVWDSVARNQRVIDHGITPQPVPYTGELAKGITVINHLHQRGRKLGGDLYDQVIRRVPVDLVGMGTAEFGGLGEVLHTQLPRFRSRYRFLFNPIRHTSLGLAVLEAMMSGMPVVALATTEYVTVIKDGVNGFIHTDIDYLTEKMQLLLQDRELAMEMGRQAAATVQERFGIQRFTRDWEAVFHYAINLNSRTYEKADRIYQ